MPYPDNFFRLRSFLSSSVDTSAGTGRVFLGLGLSRAGNFRARVGPGFLSFPKSRVRADRAGVPIYFNFDGKWHFSGSGLAGLAILPFGPRASGFGLSPVPALVGWCSGDGRARATGGRREFKKS